MSKKGENIRLRKDGRWEARITLTQKDGLSKQKSLYGKSYREVKKKMLQAKDNTETISISRRKAFKTVSDVVEEWTVSNQIKQKAATQLKYHTIINKHILSELGSLDINELDDFVINAFLAKKLNAKMSDNEKSLNPSYVKTMGIILNSIVNYAVSMGYRPPLKSKILKPSENKKDIIIMNRHSQIILEQALLHNISTTSVGVMLALHAGLRIGEVCALRWDDLDLTKGVLHIRHTVARVKNTNPECSTKTKLIIDKPKTMMSYRDIPIDTKLLDYLQKARSLYKAEYVVSEKNSFISPRTFDYRFHRLLEEYRIEDINFHGLRHTFATRCVELGVDVKTLSELLGHANVSTTLNTYVHSTIDLKRSQIEKLTLLDN